MLLCKRCKWQDPAKKTIVCTAFCYILRRSGLAIARRDHAFGMPLSATGVEGTYISLQSKLIPVFKTRDC